MEELKKQITHLLLKSSNDDQTTQNLLILNQLLHNEDMIQQIKHLQESSANYENKFYQVLHNLMIQEEETRQAQEKLNQQQLEMKQLLEQNLQLQNVINTTQVVSFKLNPPNEDEDTEEDDPEGCTDRIRFNHQKKNSKNQELKELSKKHQQQKDELQLISYENTQLQDKIKELQLQINEQKQMIKLQDVEIGNYQQKVLDYIEINNTKDNNQLQSNLDEMLLTPKTSGNENSATKDSIHSNAGGDCLEGSSAYKNKDIQLQLQEKDKQIIELQKQIEEMKLRYEEQMHQMQPDFEAEQQKQQYSHLNLQQEDKAEIVSLISIECQKDDEEDNKQQATIPNYQTQVQLDNNFIQMLQANTDQQLHQHKPSKQNSDDNIPNQSENIFMVSANSKTSNQNEKFSSKKKSHYQHLHNSHHKNYSVYTNGFLPFQSIGQTSTAKKQSKIQSLNIELQKIENFNINQNFCGNFSIFQQQQQSQSKMELQSPLGPNQHMVITCNVAIQTENYDENNLTLTTPKTEFHPNLQQFNNQQGAQQQQFSNIQFISPTNSTTLSMNQQTSQPKEKSRDCCLVF